MSNVTIDCFTARVFQDFFCLSSRRGAAAAILAAVEPGILPGGSNSRMPQIVGTFVDPDKPGLLSGRQDVAFYGGQDGRRYRASGR